MKFIDRFHRRRAAAERALAESQRELERIESQWPIVRERTEWARETRKENGLTALFQASMREKRA